MFLLILFCFFYGVTCTAISCCKDSGTELDCSNCNLTVFPAVFLSDKINLTKLDLSHNNLSLIPDGSFQNLKYLKKLILTDNPVTNFNRETFRGLQTLEHLEMGSSSWAFIPPKPPVDVLSIVKSLKVLRLYYRYRTEFDPSGLRILTNLQILEIVHPEEYLTSLGEEFTAFVNLKSLIIKKYRPSGLFLDMTDKTFENVPQLEELQITHALRNISETALIHFTQLSTLSLLCNRHLRTADVFQAIKNMKSPTLTTLILDGSFRFHTVFHFSADLIDSPNFSNISRLSLKYTRLFKIDPKVIQYCSNLKHVSLGYNSPIGKHWSHALEDLMRDLNAAKIEALDGTGLWKTSPSSTKKFHDRYCENIENTFRYPPQFLNLTAEETRREIGLNDLSIASRHSMLKLIPPSLHYIYADHAMIQSAKSLHYRAVENNVLYVDVSFDKLTRFPCLEGFTKLQGLDASSMGLQQVAEQQLLLMPSLRYVNFSHNNLHAMDLDVLVRGGLRLEWLDLGYNGIQNISLDLQNLTNLRNLSLEGNPLFDFSLKFGNNLQLQKLDLSCCLMISLPVDVTNQIDDMQSRLHHQLDLDLSGNRFECSCDTLDMIKWLQTTHVNIFDGGKLKCSHKNTSVIIMEIDRISMSKNCQLSLILEVTLPIGIGCAFLAFGLIAYRYKWHLRYYIYKGRQCVKHLVQTDEEILLDEVDTYDAFVVYQDSHDFEWVEEELLPKVSDEWGFNYCILRMFDDGRSVFKNCEDAITSSRKIILVLTPAFAADEWCQFQMELILTTRRDRIIVISKEDVPPANLSRTLLALRESGYLEYSQEPVASELFWRSLYDHLVH